jgi:hypothetical protein
MTLRACPSCSVISETDKGFCPECGTSYERPSATAAANPVTTETKGSPVRVLAVVGLAAYLLSYLLRPILLDSDWEHILELLSGYAGIRELGYTPKFGVLMILSALSGYMLLAVAIVSSKKSS